MMFRRRDEDDYEFPIQSVNKNFGNSAIPAAGQTSSAATPAQNQYAVQRPASSARPAQQQAAQPNLAYAPPAPAETNEFPKQEQFAQPAEPANKTNNKEPIVKPVNQNQAQPAKPAAQPSQVNTNSIFAQAPKSSAPQVQVVSQPATAAQQSAPATTPSISFKPSAPAAGAVSSQFNVETERRLTVGYGIFLEGKVSNCDKLVIYGDVNAELNNVKALQISDSGTFRGAAEVEQAEISGTFEGSLRVRKSILINASGRVNGKITYGSIEIKPGGKFTGEIIEDTDPQESSDTASSEPQGLDIFRDSGVDKAA